MTLKSNPKTEGSGIIACRPQTGICPIGCNQCFYNRPGAFYCDIDKPYIPSPVDKTGVPIDSIVRMNDGGDSNNQKELVIETAQMYKYYFFNTSIPNLDFPGPVVYTANPREEEPACDPWDLVNAPEGQMGFEELIKEKISNLMYVRLRVSTSNLEYIDQAVYAWIEFKIPVVLTFMAYYEKEKMPREIILTSEGELVPEKSEDSDPNVEETIRCYTWKKRHINSYFCPTKDFMAYVLKRMKKIGGRLVTMCGTLDSPWCRDCGNCKRYYQETMKHLKEDNLCT